LSLPGEGLLRRVWVLACVFGLIGEKSSGRNDEAAREEADQQEAAHQEADRLQEIEVQETPPELARGSADSHP
jgi:hypothetical protein